VAGRTVVAGASAEPQAEAPCRLKTTGQASALADAAVVSSKPASVARARVTRAP